MPSQARSLRAGKAASIRPSRPISNLRTPPRTGRCRRRRRAEGAMLGIAGIELLPAWPVFLGFVAAGLALNIVPGADMTFVIASAARGGRRDGIVAALGVGTGALVHICAAVLGLSAILASSQAIFDLIKYAGAAYLLWIAFSMVRTQKVAGEAPRQPAVPARL